MYFSSRHALISTTASRAARLARRLCDLAELGRAASSSTRSEANHFAVINEHNIYLEIKAEPAYAW